MFRILKLFLSSFLSNIKLMDMLGENINFTIDKKPTFKTVAGGTLSIFLYFIVAIMCWSFGRQIINPFKKSNPVISYHEKISKNPQNITFTNTSFIFGIRLEDEDSNYFNHSEYLHHTLHYNFRNYLSKEKTSKELKLISCTDPKFVIEGNTIGPDDFFEGINRSEWLCPDLREHNNLTISGDWEDTEIKFLEFKLSFCKEIKNKDNNKIEYHDCKNHTELLKDKLKENNYYVSILLKRFRVDYNNYKDPYDYKMTKIYNRIYDKLKKKDEIRLSKLIFIDDRGYIFEKDDPIIDEEDLLKENDVDIFVNHDFNSFKTSSGSSNLNKNTEITNETNNHYTLDIISESVTRVYKRRYKKIQEVIAEVGGSFQYFLFTFKFFYCIYANFRFDLLLFNRLVNIPDYLKINNNAFNNKMGSITGKFSIDDQKKNNKILDNGIKKKKGANNPEEGNKEDGWKKGNIKKMSKFEIKKKIKNYEMEMNVFSYFKNKNANNKLMKQKFLDNELIKEQQPRNIRADQEISFNNPDVSANKLINLKNNQSKNKILPNELKDLEANNNIESSKDVIADATKKNPNAITPKVEEKETSKRVEFKEEKADNSKNNTNNNNDSNINNIFALEENDAESKKNSESIVRKDTLADTESNKEFAQSIYDSYKNKKNTVNLFFIHYLCIIFKCTKRKKFYYYMKNKVSEKFLSKFDIFYYFKKIRNLNLIKKLLFTENQLKLVDFISNKYYTIDSLKKLKTENFLLEEKEFLECYKNLDENNKIDCKILEEINNEM